MPPEPINDEVTADLTVPVLPGPAHVTVTIEIVDPARLRDFSSAFMPLDATDEERVRSVLRLTSVLTSHISGLRLAPAE